MLSICIDLNAYLIAKNDEIHLWVQEAQFIYNNNINTKY